MYFDRNLWQLTRGLRGWIALAILLGVVASVVGIAQFAILGVLLSQVFNDAGFFAIAVPAVGVAAAVILRGVIDHHRAMISHHTASRVQEDLRGRLYDKIAALGPAWFAGERTGGVMLSIVDGVEQLQSFFGQYVPQLCVAVLTPLAIFAFIAFWDVPVAAVMLFFALVTLVAPTVFLHIERRSSHGRQQALNSFGSEFLDGVQGLPTLKAFGQSTAYGRRLAAKARELCDTTLQVLSTGVMTRGITDCGVAIGAASALALAAWRVSHGLMSIEALLIVLMAGTEVFRPLRDLRTVLHQGMVGQSAAAGINALLAAEPLVPERPSSLPATSRPLLPTIAFEDVHFAYPGGRGAAHDGLSFTVAAGEKIGIVGPSGSGKSSVARLLLRLFDPQQGTVRIGGHDLKTLDPEALRRMIAVVHQDTYLFHGTVDENLRLGKPDANPAEIERAARDANAHEFISQLPQGYATMIGERGVMLSGGQRQRLAIARALLRDAPILILDEALSSVDAENEAVIQQAIDRLASGRTTLILAHRLSSVIGADRILVLDKGRIVESGRHAELIRRDGPYRRLMGAQAEDRDDGGDLIEDVPVADGPRDREQIDTSGESATDAMAGAAAVVGWGATLGTLVRVIKPWRRRFAIVVTSGIARVAAFIGVGIISALAVAAVKFGSPFGYLLILLALAAPLAGLPPLARILARARHRLSVIGGDADRSLPQAGHPGAGLSGASPLRRPRRSRQSGRRDHRILFRPYRGAGVGRDPRPDRRAGDLGSCRLADRLGFAALCSLCRPRSGVDASPDRSPWRGGARLSRSARRLCHRDDSGPQRPRGLPGAARPAARLHGLRSRLPADPPRSAERFVVADGPAGNCDRARRARRRGGRRPARRRAPDHGDDLAVVDPVWRWRRSCRSRRSRMSAVSSPIRSPRPAAITPCSARSRP